MGISYNVGEQTIIYSNKQNKSKTSKWHFRFFQILSKQGQWPTNQTTRDFKYSSSLSYVSFKTTSSDPTTDSLPLPPTSIENHPIIQPAAAVDHKSIMEGTMLKTQVVVQRTSLPVEELLRRTWKIQYNHILLYTLRTRYSSMGVGMLGPEEITYT